MYGFKQQPLSLQLIKVIGVEEEYEVDESIAKDGADHERPPAVSVRPGPGEKDKDAGWDGLDDVVVSLQLRHVLLHLVLFLLVLLDFVADLFGDVQVDFADFLQEKHQDII